MLCSVVHSPILQVTYRLIVFLCTRGGVFRTGSVGGLLCDCVLALFMCLHVCPMCSHHDNHFKPSQTVPGDNSWSGSAGLQTTTEKKTKSKTKQGRSWEIELSRFSSRIVSVVPLSPPPFVSACKVDDLSRFCLSGLSLLSAAPKWIGMCWWGVKGMNLQGRAEEGCARVLSSPGWLWIGGLWSQSSPSWIWSFSSCQQVYKRRASECGATMTQQTLVLEDSPTS